jgi:hypothetical protein
MRLVAFMKSAAGSVLAIAAALGTQAHAADPYCPNAAHEEPAEVPADLIAPVAATLGIDAATAPEGTFVRCVGPTLMACTIGANLVCDKADTSKDNVGATSWCKDNAGSDFVPMFATGHATVYEWSCDGTTAVAGKQVFDVDDQGYIAQNWKAVE